MCVIRVLPAVLGGRLLEEEELVQVPVPLRGGRVAESQPLIHLAPRMGVLDAVLQAQAGEQVGRARQWDMSLQVEYPQGLQVGR